MVEKKEVINWAYPTTVGGMATEGKCFGKLTRTEDFVILYLRLLSSESHSTTSYLDYTTDNGIIKGFRPLETVYHTTGNINNNRNVTVRIEPNGRIGARLDTANLGKVNIYTTIIYPIK